MPVVSPAILDEYVDVLRRPELPLPPDSVGAILAYLLLPGTHVAHADPSEVAHVCADPGDDIFLATAVEGNAGYLVTGNMRHFPSSPWRGVRIVNAARFVRTDQG